MELFTSLLVQSQANNYNWKDPLRKNLNLYSSVECLEFLKYGIICLCENKSFFTFYNVARILAKWRNVFSFFCGNYGHMDTWSQKQIKKKKKRPPIMMTSAFQLRVRINVSWFGKCDPFFIFDNAVFPT